MAENKKEYGATLNLPKTDFDMRANLPQKEPKFLKTWEENKIYEKGLDASKPLFMLHDGPPYANGDIHIGHVLNKTLKDIVMKYKRMQGFRVPYVPGWDTHGLPIEQKVMEKLGDKAHDFSEAEIRDYCKEYALSFVAKQRDEFKRLGILGEWDNPYVTLAPEYEAKQLEVFKELFLNGYVYKGLKPIYWCTHDDTALAEAEIEYADHKSPSIFVRFEVEKKDLAKFGVEQAAVVIWTTTPWTLPGNIAISLNPEFEYAVVKTAEFGNLVLAYEMVEKAMKEMNISEYEVIKRGLKGSELEFAETQHPFLERKSLIILGDHVTADAGTGCVHTAPGHGQEDYQVCLKYNLPIISPVNNKGVLTVDAGQFAGMFYKKANKAIIEFLTETKQLINMREIEHSYPHCWRCKNPVIFRATEQWFVSVDKSDIREKAMKALQEVKFTPKWGINRIGAMIETRPDWCISRQRIWGVPIPIFYCESCGKVHYNEEIANAVIEKVKAHGSNIWLTSTPAELIGELAKCECGSHEFRKETNIMDVWFDSGVSHRAVLETRANLAWPADLYLEGSDQHRGWFQTSLLTSVGTRGVAPYKQILTHGFVNDGEGKKMSKSKGNVVAPQTIISQYGADILRLWCASTDYREDVKISENLVKQVAENYRRMRNTVRYLLGNISDFNATTDRVAYENLTDLDKWALHKLELLKEKACEFYSEFEFYNVFNDINYFVSVEMSAFYLDIIKDRLYVERKDDIRRRAAQTVMVEILDVLTKLMAPVLSFTAEELWQVLPESLKTAESVHLADWVKLKSEFKNETIFEKFNKISEIRSEGNREIELLRKDKVVGHSLDTKLTFVVGKESPYANILTEYASDLEDIMIASEATVQLVEGAEFKVHVEKAAGEKCERCWKYSTEILHSGEHEGLCPRCASVLGK